MSNNYFAFKEFTIQQHKSAMKVTTDACLFGAWVAAYLQKKTAAGTNLLDIGTGTGLLALMVAQKNKLAIDAVEIDEFAAAQARENVAGSDFGKNIDIVQADITEHQTKDYDFIISNPPFYEKEIVSATTEKRRAHHSEDLSWEQLFSTINDKLKAEGQFFLLLPHKRQNDLQIALKKQKLFAEEMVTVRHTLHHPPLRLLLRGSKKPCETIVSELAIKEGPAYSPAFIALLQDYYLYL